MSLTTNIGQRAHACRRAEAASANCLRLIGTAAALAAFIAGVALAPLTAHAAPTATTVSTAKIGLGQILVDSRGRTLYLFEKDHFGRSACSGKCTTFWPPLLAIGKPRAAAGIKPSLLGTTKRADGRMQVTYNRHPLYLFIKDTKAGQTNGEALSVFGARWYAVSPAGSKVAKAGTNRSGY